MTRSSALQAISSLTTKHFPLQEQSRSPILPLRLFPIEPESIISPHMTPPLISLQNVSVTLDGRKALTDVTWELPASAACAVLGENGAGKTTFLRLARGDVWPDQDGRGVRRYHFQGLTRTSPIGFRERFGLVGPELQDNLIRLKPGIDGLTLVLTGSGRAGASPHLAPATYGSD